MMAERGRLLFQITMGLAIAVILTLGFTVFTYIRVVNTSRHLAAETQADAQRTVQAEQTSRFDGALVSCERLNERHLNALPYVAELERLNPAAGTIATSLIEVLAPLRDGRQGRETCEQYALSEVALNLPPFIAPVAARK